jgi:excisionase family DNA binding protein
MTIETIYTMQEVMEILKVSMATVTIELTSGRLKSFRVGRQYRIAESSLQSYIRGEFIPADYSKDDKLEEDVQPTKETDDSIIDGITDIKEVPSEPVSFITTATITPQSAIIPEPIEIPEEVSTEVATSSEPLEQPEIPATLSEPANEPEPLGTADVPPTTEPLELILKLKANGLKHREIAEHLNSLGIKTKRGKDWTDDSVFKLIKANR